MSEHKELVERLRGFIVRDDSGLGPRIGLKGINVSDIEDAIRDLEAQAAEIGRLTNNRDMWKGQCERQAKVIQCYRDYQATVPASRAWAASAQD